MEGEKGGVPGQGNESFFSVADTVVGEEAVGFARPEMRQFFQRGACLGDVPDAPLHQREIGKAFFRRMGDQIETNAVRKVPPLDPGVQSERRKILSVSTKNKQQAN